MSRRLTITLTASIALHLGLLALLAWVSLWPQRRAATLSEAGGVVWFNLNPGGAGSGGAGGLGAPEAADPQASAPQTTGKAAAPAKSTEKTFNDPQASHKIPKKLKAPLKVMPSLPEEPKKPSAEKALLPPGLPGPGTGDSAGTKTGPGDGAGEGLGSGEGSGTGGGKGPGGIGAPGSGGSGSGGEASAILAKIRQKIARAKRYPRQARAEELEGVAGLQFEINADGSVAYVNLTASSGHPVLDEEALATVRRAAPFPFYAGPIRFSLRFSLKDSL